MPLLPLVEERVRWSWCWRWPWESGRILASAVSSATVVVPRLLFFDFFSSLLGVEVWVEDVSLRRLRDRDGVVAEVVASAVAVEVLASSAVEWGGGCAVDVRAGGLAGGEERAVGPAVATGE